MEAVHQEAYSLLLETLGKSDDIVYKSFWIYKLCQKNMSILTDFNMDTPHDMAKTMAVYSGFTEGVQLF